MRRARFLCSSSRLSQGAVSSRSRSNRFRFLFRKVALLRFRGVSVLRADGREAAEESIDDSSRVKQVFQRAEGGCGRCRLSWRGQIGPIGRNQRFTAIGQNQNEEQATFAIHRSENAERFAFERMARTENGYSFRQVLMTGSVS